MSVASAATARPINCGVSEQNMIGVAAGMAKNNLRVFAYSIAPFIYARPFEQIKNDIVLSDLPVCLIGNGGGYAYGYQGPTHYAIEDCAAMNALGVEVLVPSFDQDISCLLTNINRPSYLRLGIEKLPKGKKPPPYKPWRLLEKGSNGVVVALGPLAGMVWETILELPKKNRPSLWAVNNFNTGDIPDQFLKNINKHIRYTVLLFFLTFARAIAIGRPTYPSPIMPILLLVMSPIIGGPFLIPH